MLDRAARAASAGTAAALALAVLTACATAEAPSSGEGASAVPQASPTASVSAPAAPGITWSTVYQESFDDPQAAQAWIWKGKFPPTVADGRMSWSTQSGQAGYLGIGADGTHAGFGGGAEDDSLRSIRVTATVSLEGIAAYGGTCLDAESGGGYGSVSMYLLTVSATGAEIAKVLDDGPSETVATSDGGVLPDPFTGAITLTCAPVPEGYYLAVAVDDDVALATVDTGAIPVGRNARLYEAAGPVDEPTISLDEVRIEVPAG